MIFNLNEGRLLDSHIHRLLKIEKGIYHCNLCKESLFIDEDNQIQGRDKYDGGNLCLADFITNL